MTSNDNQQFVTIEMLKSETGEIKAEIHGLDNKINELHTEILAVRDIVLTNSAKIDAYKDSNALWFTGIAILVAIVGIIATLAPMLREIYKDAKEARSRNTLRQAAKEIMQDEFHSTVAQAVNEAVAQALGVRGK